MSDIQQRIQRLEDIKSIEQLKYKYLHACDDKDPEAMISVFTKENCEIDYGEVGVFNNRESLKKVYTAAACHDYMIESHHAHNPIINIIDSDKAIGVWALTYQLINTKDLSIVKLKGIYEDEYIKDAGEWLISKTKFILKSTFSRQIEKKFLKVIFAG